MNPSCHKTIGMRGIAYHFDGTAPIDDIPQLAANPALLAAFKECGHATYAKSTLSVTQQAVVSARKTLERCALSAAEIDAVCIGTSEIPYWNHYPELMGTEILKGLALCDIPVVGITLAGCANYASSLRVARNMLLAEDLRNVLVIETNQVRGDMQRPILSAGGSAGGIYADGAASFVLTTGPADFEVLGMAQVVKPIDRREASVAELISNNLRGYCRVFEDALREAQIAREDIEVTILTNVNLEAVNSVATILGLPSSSVFTANIARTAHVWSADNLINLHDYCETRTLAPGTKFVMLCQADSYYSAVLCKKTTSTLAAAAAGIDLLEAAP